MSQHDQPTTGLDYPHGRGYGHDYMRGGEVLGGYGYSARAEYEATLGELTGGTPRQAGSDSDNAADADGGRS